MKKKGNPRVLTDEQEEEMYQDWLNTDKPLKVYADQYNVSYTTILTAFTKKLKKK